MATFLTIIAGVCVFVLGQLALKMFIEPIQELRKVIATINNDLFYYAGILTNPRPYGDERMMKASDAMRVNSARLVSTKSLIPFYKHLHKAFALPHEPGIKKAKEKLIFLSNGFEGNLENQSILNLYAIQHVKEGLGIYISADEKLDPSLEIRLVTKTRN